MTLREALSNAAVYPEPTTTVEVRETHISLVFLTDHYAYKIKKPVDLGFLDFSTLEKRRFYCEQELLLNRRLSHDVYLDVVALYHDARQHYTFTPQGPAVEYAVKMRHLPEARCLESLLAHNAITPPTMERLAQRLTAFYKSHPLPDSAGSHGTLERVQETLAETLSHSQDYFGLTLSAETFQQIQHDINLFFARHPGWFAERRHQGFIRDCHGDLRAEHIYMLDDERLDIIDCIEFTPRFRYIDVAADLAFLVQDLERLGHAAMAQCLLRAYVEAADDLTIYRLLDFYCAYRAYVRGKVTSIRLQSTSAETEALGQHARACFMQASRYAARSVRPLLLLTGGMIGSGKSTVAREIAAALDLPIYSSDRLRKEQAGLSLTASRQAAQDAGLYTAAAREHIYDVMAELARQQLEQGQSVLVDATFASQAQRQRFLALAQDMGADGGIIVCGAPEAVLRQRLRQREQEPGVISDAREDVFEQFQRTYEPVHAAEAPCVIPLDTTRSVSACVQDALHRLWSCRP